MRRYTNPLILYFTIVTDYDRLREENIARHQTPPPPPYEENGGSTSQVLPLHS